MLKGKTLESNLKNEYTSFISPASLKQYNLDPSLPTVDCDAVWIM